IKQIRNKWRQTCSMLFAEAVQTARLRARGGDMSLHDTIVTILEYFYLAIIFLMTAQAIFNIRLRLYIWEEPQQAWLNSAPSGYREPQPPFPILLPAHHAEDCYFQP